MSVPHPYSSMIGIVRRMALAIGAVVSLLVPLSFGISAYVDLGWHLEQGARLSADRIAQYAFIQGETWRFSGHRVAELIGGLAASVDLPRQIVEHANGNRIAEIGTPLSGLKISQTWPIVVQGETVGSVRVEHSLIPFLLQLGFLVLVGVCLGGAAYLSVYRLPLGTLRRVSDELEKAQTALVASHATLSEALRVMPDAFALFDSEDRLTLFNWRYLSIHGLNEDDVAVGTTFEEILRLCVARGQIADAIGREEAWIAERLEQHRSFDGAVEQELANGRRLRIVERTTADDGRIGVLTDITSLKRSEEERIALREQLHQSQKLEAVGKLTGGMAHDFNNYLGVIIGNLDLLGDRVDPAGKAFLNAALQGAENCAQLTQNLLAYARRQPLSPRQLDLGRSFESIAGQLTRSLGEDIVLTVEAAPDVWPVRIDSAQLNSCIVNLANNARDAMSQGGSLTISARNVRVDEIEARRFEEAAPGDYVLIEVSDTGAGMSPKTVSQVFDPFFSTKPVGHGTGLGLSMVYGFVKQSGGWVDIHSELGRGTRVALYLPRDPDAPETLGGTAGADSKSAPRQSKSILVVEDNAMVRQTVAHQLSSLGYRTIEAENGSAALAILGQRERPVDLLFTDMIMPGDIDGYELVQRARDIRPGIKALLTSGYPGDALSDRPRADVALLAKPYRLAGLAQAIRAALDAAPA